MQGVRSADAQAFGLDPSPSRRFAPGRSLSHKGRGEFLPALIETPLPLWERERPDAKHWEGEGSIEDFVSQYR